MTILIIGGQAKIGLRISRLLHAANYSGLVTLRSGAASDSPFKVVPFDWTDPSAFGNPFNADAHIDRVYLLAPPIVDMLPLMQPFIDLAITKGVKRFVLMSAAQCEKDGHTMGKVHSHLDGLGVEYVALRPIWFSENFTLQLLPMIRDVDTLFSATDDGEIRFVDSDDIVDAAFEALTNDRVASSSLFILGPDAYSYDEVAEIFTEILGRKITHKRLSYEESIKLYQSFGVLSVYTDILIKFEQSVANGVDETWFASKDKVVGKRHLRDYLEANKQLWIPEAKDI